MLEARAGHACVAFQDRTSLVAGGATNSEEVCHPDTRSWTVNGAMLTARTGAAAQHDQSFAPHDSRGNKR